MATLVHRVAMTLRDECNARIEDSYQKTQCAYASSGVVLVVRGENCGVLDEEQPDQDRDEVGVSALCSPMQ